MPTRPTTRRTDSIFGAVCGLSLAAIFWSLLRSPDLASPGAVVFLLAGLPLGSTHLTISRSVRRQVVLAFVLLCLLTHGLGTAIVGRFAIGVVRRRRGLRHRSGSRRLGELYGLAAGTAVTTLAGLGYLAVGGTVPFSPSGVGWIGLGTFLALYTVAERVSTGLAEEIPSRGSGAPAWPGWLRAVTGNALAVLAASLVALLYHEAPSANWTIPVALGSGLVLTSLATRRGSRVERKTGAQDRALARAIAIASSGEHGPPLRARRLCRIAIDLGRATQMNEQQLDGLEIAAWMCDIERLEPPPPPRHWPEARRFGDGPVARFDPMDLLDTLRLPESVTSVIRHLGERWDGSGEPGGLSGAQIPLGARVLAVARDFVSMTTPAGSRHVLTPQRALAELRSETGRAFDPRVVDALARLHGERRIHGDEEHVDPSEELERTPPRDSERLTEARHELDLLYDIRQCVRLGIDLDETLILVFEKLRQLVPHAAGVVWVFDGDQTDLHPRFVRGAAEATLRRTVLPVSGTTSGRVARTRCAASFQATGPTADAAWDLDVVSDTTAAKGLRTALAAPLIGIDGCRGALTVYDRIGRRFDSAERRALVAVGALVGEAVAAAPRPRAPILDSLTDPLTGLPNGRYLEIYAGDLTPSSPAPDEGFGVLAFRVRDLERVYERSGVSAGERLLGSLARRLAADCVPSEVPVRYGHDLFLVLSPVGAQVELVRRWDSLLRAVEGTPVELRAGQVCRPRLASAHACCPADGADLDELLEVLGIRLGLAFDRGHKVVPFRAVRSSAG